MIRRDLLSEFSNRKFDFLTLTATFHRVNSKNRVRPWYSRSIDFQEHRMDCNLAIQDRWLSVICLDKVKLSSDVSDGFAEVFDNLIDVESSNAKLPYGTHGIESKVRSMTSNMALQDPCFIVICNQNSESQFRFSSNFQGVNSHNRDLPWYNRYIHFKVHCLSSKTVIQDPWLSMTCVQNCQSQISIFTASTASIPTIASFRDITAIWSSKYCIYPVKRPYRTRD
jgi:hypothetical protein